MTRDETYKKSKQKFIPIIKLLYKKYPNLIKAIENRHNNYNNSLSIVNDLCKKDKALTIRPKNHLKLLLLQKYNNKAKYTTSRRLYVPCFQKSQNLINEYWQGLK